jgi:hypothetical protein
MITGTACAQHSLKQQQLLARLAELVERKGYKDVDHAKSLCESLGLATSNRDCLWYQYPEKEDVRTLSANVFREGPGRAPHILFINHDGRTGSFYHVAPNGLLASAFTGIRRKIWHLTRLSASASSIQADFLRELTYWKKKLGRIEKESDRKLVDDPSCPKGQLRETWGDEKPSDQSRCVRP